MNTEKIKMIRLKYLAVLFTLLLAVPASLVAEDKALTGADIIARVEAQPRPKSSAVKMKMTLIQMRGNREEKQERVLQVVAKDSADGGRSLLRFVSPAAIKGVSLLVVEHKDADTDQWLYMPSVGKPSRISGAQRKGSFMGSDFSYEDMEPRDPGSGIHTLLREEQVNGKDAWVVESKSKTRGDSSYSKVILWIRKDITVPVKAEFYDLRGNLKKVMRAEDLREEGGYWTARRTVMEDIRRKSSTVLEVLEQKNDITVKDEMFTERMLTKG